MTEKLFTGTLNKNQNKKNLNYFEEYILKTYVLFSYEWLLNKTSLTGKVKWSSMRLNKKKMLQSNLKGKTCSK